MSLTIKIELAVARDAIFNADFQISVSKLGNIFRNITFDCETYINIKTDYSTTLC